MLRAVAASAGADLSGYVLGPDPGVSTNNATVRWDGTDGREVKDSPFWTTTDNGASTILGPTGTAPGFYAGLTGDTVPRILLGINSSDIARIGFGPGGSTARETFITRGSGGGVDITNGTVATSIPVLSLSQTPNSAGTTFALFRVNHLGTTSAVGTLLADLQTASATVFSVNRLGVALGGDGTVSLPTYAFVSDPDTGIYRFGSNVLGFACGGSDVFAMTSTGVLQLRGSAPELRFSSAGDLSVFRDAADVWAQRRTTNAQTFRVYRTFTNSTNYERAAIQTGAGYMELASETAGTGADDLDLRLTPAGTGSVRLAAGVALLTVATTVGALGSAATVGQRKFVSDALTPVFGTAVAAGGAVAVPVFADGTNWIVG